MHLRIQYESEDFPPNSGVASRDHLTTSWGEVLWAALTVGRPSRNYVFGHGTASGYEALFRLSLVRMTLEQSGPTSTTLRRTAASRTLDPTEKGAVNYFIGMAICKLFAASLLDAPWLLHLDVWRPELDAVLKGRSRPDLVGQNTNGDWIAFECKGRGSTPGVPEKQKAKDQAVRLISVRGVHPRLHISAITYFRNDVLQFYWRDPEPVPSGVRNPIHVPFREDDWSAYYATVLGLIRANERYLQQMRQAPILMPVPEADVEIGIHPTVLKLIMAGQWEEARNVDTTGELAAEGLRYHRDGIAVFAGPSWLRPFREGVPE